MKIRVPLTLMWELPLARHNDHAVWAVRRRLRIGVLGGAREGHFPIVPAAVAT